MMISAALAAEAGRSATEPADVTVTMVDFASPVGQVFVLEDIDGEIGCAHPGVLLWLCQM